jgi:hypothetical protein
MMTLGNAAAARVRLIVTYTQQGGSWVLIPLTTANNGARH